jgi:KEOPS complex subunit Pcc1
MPDRTTLGDGPQIDGSRGPDGDVSDHRLDVEFEYPSEQCARVVADSVAVEVGEMPDERSGATVDREGRVVTVGIGAADLVALRAGTNTWVRLVGVAEDVAVACDALDVAAGCDGQPERT